MIDRILRKFGYTRTSTITEQLDFGPSIRKRLDEHREDVEALARRTDYLQQYPEVIHHAAIQDDFLLRVYHLVHGAWPGEEGHPNTVHSVRPRPEILPPCALPEYPANRNRPWPGVDQAPRD